MIMAPPKNLRLHWDADHGWIVDVPWAMPEEMLRQVARVALPRQLDRWRSLPPGEKKTELKEALVSLQRLEVRQNVVGARGDGKGDIILHSASKGR